MARAAIRKQIPHLLKRRRTPIGRRTTRNARSGKPESKQVRLCPRLLCSPCGTAAFKVGEGLNRSGAAAKCEPFRRPLTAPRPNVVRELECTARRIYSLIRLSRKPTCVARHWAAFIEKPWRRRQISRIELIFKEILERARLKTGIRSPIGNVSKPRRCRFIGEHCRIIASAPSSSRRRNRLYRKGVLAWRCPAIRCFFSFCRVLPSYIWRRPWKT